MKLHLARDANPSLEITWANGDPANKEKIESPYRQVFLAFSTAYWWFAGAGLTPSPTDEFEARKTDNGGFALTWTTKNAKTVAEVDNDLVLQKIVEQTPVMTTTVRVQFASIPDEPRRLSEIDIHREMGTNIANAHINMDYQDVGGFHVPRHVRFGMGGALETSFDLTNCSAR